MKRSVHSVGTLSKAQVFPEITIQPSAFFLLAFLVLVGNRGWLLAFLISVLWHEGFHLLTLKAMGCCASEVSIGLSGARIHAGVLSRRQEVLCALAGPAGSLLLTLTAPLFPRLALVSLFHAVFNLIPVYPLDGGRVLRGMLSEPYGPVAERISSAVFLLILWRIAGKIVLWGIMLVFVRDLTEKYLAKNRRSGYNRATI